MRILVIGDSCEDHYIYCASDRFCPDAPVPVLNPVKTIKSLGMAGNVSDNLRSLGAEVDILSNTEKIKKRTRARERTGTGERTRERKQKEESARARNNTR